MMTLFALWIALPTEQTSIPMAATSYGRFKWEISKKSEALKQQVQKRSEALK